MLFVHQSNQLELLAEQFSEHYRNPVVDPLASELVVVPNYAIERWLSLTLADHLGISANLSFSFPAEFSWAMLRTVIGTLPETAPFAPGNLRWRILSLLEAEAAEFPELDAYLHQADQKRVYELACQIETIFDRYLFYRPGWILDWENGQDADHWQARLWGKLVAETQGMHWVNLRHKFTQCLASPKRKLPLRVSFFGVTELSPGYLELLGSLSLEMDIHIFAVNPCEVFWSDITDEKSILKAADAVSEYLEVGNPLLASMGRQGRDFFDLLLSLNCVEEKLRFVPLQADTLLSHIQQDVLALHQREANSTGDISATPDFLASISIHSCHSWMREAEVIHDQILAALARDASLTPADVVIMTPDIEIAAPYLDAVFSTATQKLPYTISDIGLNSTNEMAETLLALLEIPGSRFEVNRILGLLEFAVVRARFGLDKTAVKQIADWCLQTNIRWGIDAQSRKKSGLPETHEHSWKNGLNRMLLGYMMNSDGFYEGTLAYTEIEGSLAVDLGRFVEFAEKLFTIAAWETQKLSLPKWIENLNQTIDLFSLAENSESVERQQLRALLQGLADQGEVSGYDNDLDFKCLRHLVQQEIENNTDSRKFMSEGVTVSRFSPMRNVPFAVVCLMGMNDKDFPKRIPKQSFDLASQAFWRGDRSARNADRYLFLESILSARKKLIISYSGQDIQTNESRPPSVLVNELLDYIETGYGVAAKEMVVKHPLQSFSTRYLNQNPEGEQPLFTYQEFAQGKGSTDQTGRFQFMDDDAVIAIETPEIIELSQLERFFKSPVRYFLQQVMGISLGEELADLAEREPFQIESFIDAEILQMIADNEAEALIRLRALGYLPHGKPGDQLFEQQQQIAHSFLSRLPALDSPKTEHFEIKVGSTVLRGSLNNLYPDGQFIVQMNPVWASWRIPVWLRHLVLCSIDSNAYDHSTKIFTPDEDVCLAQVDHPQQYLQSLIDTFIEGQSKAIKLFPKTSYEYALADKPEKALEKATGKWLDAFNYTGEGSKEEYQLAFRGSPMPLDNEFTQLSEKLFKPFISHLQDS